MSDDFSLLPEDSKVRCPICKKEVTGKSVFHILDGMMCINCEHCNHCEHRPYSNIAHMQYDHRLCQFRLKQFPDHPFILKYRACLSKMIDEVSPE